MVPIMASDAAPDDPTVPASSATTERFIVRLAGTLVSCGFPVSTVQGLASRLARRYGMPHLTIYAMPTVVILDDSRNVEVRMEPAPVAALRADQVWRVEELADLALRQSTAPRAAMDGLQSILASKAPVPIWLRSVGYAVACAGFAAVLRMSAWGIVVSTALGLLVGIAQLLAGERPRLAPIVPAAAAFLCTFGLVTIASGTGLGYDPVRVAATPLLGLLPGMVLTAATLELMGGHILAGATRLVYGLAILLSMGFGFFLAVEVTHADSVVLADLTRISSPAWMPWAGSLVYAVGVMAYLCTPWAAMPSAVLVVLSASGTLMLLTGPIGQYLAAGTAAAVAYVLSYWLGRRRAGAGLASMTLFIPAYWLIVPGSVGYVVAAGAYSGSGSLVAGAGNLVAVILAMAVGIMLASIALPNADPPVRWTQDPGGRL